MQNDIRVDFVILYNRFTLQTANVFYQSHGSVKDIQGNKSQ